MEKLCRLLFLCFFQFQLSMCDLLALKLELDALCKCYDKPPIFQTSLFVLLFLYQIQQKNAPCLLGYKKHLFGLKPTSCYGQFVSFKEVLVIVFTTSSQTLRKSSSLSPYLVDDGQQLFLCPNLRFLEKKGNFTSISSV